MPPGGNRRIDRVLDPSFVEGIDRSSLAVLREKRDECAEEESVLSYERSLIHTRLRLLKAEADRRRTGGSARSIIDNLAQILSDENVTHRGSFPSLEAPPIVDNPRRRVEKLVNDDTLARLPDLSDEEISSTTAALEDAEREVSESRRAVHAVLDRFIEEIGRRKAGADA